MFLPVTLPVSQTVVRRFVRKLTEHWTLWLAFEITGFNGKLEHLVLSDQKITSDTVKWLDENVGSRSVDWDWMHYPNEPGSIYGFKDENKAILFRLAGLE